jgi:hypothetical protein
MPDPGPAFGAKLLQNIEGRELRQARAILIVLGLLNVISQGLLYAKIGQQVSALHRLGEGSDGALFDHLRYAALAGAAVGCVFIACGLAIFRKPMAASITGLVLYLITLGIQLALDPSSLVNDLFTTGVRVVIVIGLGSAVQFARIYARNERARRDFPKASVVKS